MPAKCIQKRAINKSRLPDSLNSRRWRFLPSGLDDFRDGFPPLCDSIMMQPHTKGSDPIVLPSIATGLGTMQQWPKRKLPAKPHCSASKLSLMQKTRRSCIAQTEHCLSQHPLALYPHLEESIPPELFKEVVGVLDPEMLPVSEEAGACLVEQEHQTSSTVKSRLENERGRQTKSKFTNHKYPKVKNPYTWFSKKEVKAREREAILNYIPPVSENVKQATEELCSWLESLGGEKYDIDEATVISLFDAGYETKIPNSVPINVEELQDLPAELQMYVGKSPLQTTMKSQPKEFCQPKREKIRYGAWYLDPKTWKKQKRNEPLVDPKSKDADTWNSGKMFDGKDTEIIELHGIHAFKEFLERKGYQLPEVSMVTSNHCTICRQQDHVTSKTLKNYGLLSHRESPSLFSLSRSTDLFLYSR
uniref:Family with sequence similarity 47 member E n=1 Tax=Anolis carolinensis TaxID=28377 RepID=A0A803TQS8_ANOCA|nr:PREDICTED: protein FAM47E isoform X1 [Anolis carolinensis]|eukprot:XP_008110366.1 PREDICTED: protein FAM47E isoform X1 [Anolis carolinensis]